MARERYALGVSTLGAFLFPDVLCGTFSNIYWLWINKFGDVNGNRRLPLATLGSCRRLLVTHYSSLQAPTHILTLSPTIFHYA